MTLKAARPGSRVIVQKLQGQGEVKRRLMDMGIIPGTEIQVQKVAPLGDPVEIKFKGYNLSLRWEEAETIVVEILSPPSINLQKHPRHHRYRHRHKRS
jgi:ferrous iron transport protein A